MNKIFIGAMALFATFLLGCSTPTMLPMAVGPNPFITTRAGSDGFLQVFTAREEENNVGFETPYSQRTDYSIYDSNGKRLEHVADNNKGEFNGTPRMIRLPAGSYSITALAAVGLGEWLKVPVVIESGRTTEVHLNGHWKPPTDAGTNEFVHVPSGFPVGWRAGSTPKS